MRMRHIVICSLSGPTILLHIILKKGTIFEGGVETKVT